MNSISVLTQEERLSVFNAFGEDTVRSLYEQSSDHNESSEDLALHQLLDNEIKAIKSNIKSQAQEGLSLEDNIAHVLFRSKLADSLSVYFKLCGQKYTDDIKIKIVQKVESIKYGDVILKRPKKYDYIKLNDYRLRLNMYDDSNESFKHRDRRSWKNVSLFYLEHKKDTSIQSLKRLADLDFTTYELQVYEAPKSFSSVFTPDSYIQVTNVPNIAANLCSMWSWHVEYPGQTTKTKTLASQFEPELRPIALYMLNNCSSLNELVQGLKQGVYEKITATRMMFYCRDVESNLYCGLLCEIKDLTVNDNFISLCDECESLPKYTFSDSYILKLHNGMFFYKKLFAGVPEDLVLIKDQNEIVQDIMSDAVHYSKSVSLAQISDNYKILNSLIRSIKTKETVDKIAYHCLCSEAEAKSLFDSFIGKMHEKLNLNNLRHEQLEHLLEFNKGLKQRLIHFAKQQLNREEKAKQSQETSLAHKDVANDEDQPNNALSKIELGDITKENFKDLLDHNPDLKDQLLSLLNESKPSSSLIDTAEGQLKALNDEIISKKKELEIIQRDQDKILSVITKQLQETHSSVTSQAKDELQRLHSDIDSTSKELEIIQRDKDKILSVITKQLQESHSSTNSQAKDELKRLHADIDSSTKELEIIQRDKDKILTTIIKQLQDNHSSNINQAKDELKRLQADIDSKTKELEIIHEEIINAEKEKRNIIDQTHAQLQLADDVQAEVAQRIEEAQAQASSFIATMCFSSNIPASIAHLLKPISYETFGPSDALFESLNDWYDVIEVVKYNLIETGITKSSNHDFGYGLAIYLCAAYLLKQPILLTGHKAKDIAIAFAHAIDRGRYGELNCLGEYDHSAVQNIGKNHEKIVLLNNLITSNWINRAHELFAKPKVFFIATHSFKEDLQVEPISLYNYVLPLITEFMVDQDKQVAYELSSLSNELESSNTNDNYDDEANISFSRLGLSPMVERNINRLSSTMMGIEQKALASTSCDKRNMLKIQELLTVLPLAYCTQTLYQIKDEILLDRQDDHEYMEINQRVRYLFKD